MTSTETAEDRRFVTIELPAAVVDKLKDRARRNQRSFSGELRYVLIRSAEESDE